MVLQRERDQLPATSEPRSEAKAWKELKVKGLTTSGRPIIYISIRLTRLIHLTFHRSTSLQLFPRTLLFPTVTPVKCTTRIRLDQICSSSIEPHSIGILIKSPWANKNSKLVSLINIWMDSSRSRKPKMSKKEYSKSIHPQRLEWLITKTRLTLTSEMSIAPWESPTNQSSSRLLKVENGKTSKLLNRSFKLNKLNRQETISVLLKKNNDMALLNLERATNLEFLRFHKNLTKTCQSSFIKVEDWDHKALSKANVISDKKA